MKKVAIIQARMGSSRFPGKVLENLADKPLLKRVVDRASAIPNIDAVVVATSDGDLDIPIVEWCIQNAVNYFKGSENDVLARYYFAAKEFNADVVMRITADCPLLDPNIAAQVLYLVSSGLADYSSNVLPATWPDGLDCEAFTFQTLEFAHLNATRISDREHVTPYIRNNQHRFKVLNVSAHIPGLQKHRWTVDTKEDLLFIEQLILKSKPNASTYEFLETLAKKTEIKQTEQQRNEGFVKSLQTEINMLTNFAKSQELLEQAIKTIPLGAQTFSKSHIQYPENTSPMFLTHGLGSASWDVDGNEYVDFISALLPNILGYNDPDVNFAIQTQLSKGISFSLSTELEMRLAEKLCSIIPCAQSVRFAKNGTDVTSAAIRIARSYTKRDKVLVCGYHGWQDWYIGTTTRNKGVPKAVSDLSTVLPYNDLNRLEELLKGEEYAAVIMEPCNITPPQEGYLAGVKALCEQFQTVLIFDEVITGFRFALGGAQEYFNVTPHLACFGKAMGNGMPISAIVGQKDIMHEVEEIFFSGTFGGEALSIAASLATIEKMEREPVLKNIWQFGQDLSQELDKILIETSLQEVIKPGGYAPWRILQFLPAGVYSAFDVKTFFIQEMIKRGILINSSFNINYAHSDFDKYKCVKALQETLSLIQGHIANSTLLQNLQSPSIQPLFKVR